jgi:uncharacterized repeat protein (TIGR01451 family)
VNEPCKGRSQSAIRRLLLTLCALLITGHGLLLPPADAQSPDSPRRVNIPYFSDDITWAETAIFWFGQNEQGVPSKNYVDMRVGYTSDALMVQATVVDYYLWYDQYATATSDLTQYDAIAVYLDTTHDQAATPQSDDYWFLIGARHWQNMDNYMRQAQGNGSGWNTSWTPTADWSAQSSMSWSCNPGPNSNECGIDYGWTAIFTTPWETMGLSGPPSEGTLWGLGVLLYDRDDEPPAGYVAPEYWPETFDADSPATWGELYFGYADYESPLAIPEDTTMIRAASPEDNTVEDARMGGGGTCSGGHEGGSEVNHGDETDLFVGTETAPTHFPCFNKSYLRFSLDAIPAGKTIISASLTLHLWGHAGETPDLAQPSWVHLFTINDPWEEMTIHWNNAPSAQENVSAIWVYPYSSPGNIQWPGDSYTWDATQAAAEAYAEGQPVSLAIYGSDTAQHSSKYLTSSETGDWNAEGRPTLRVRWGNPVGTMEKTASPSAVMPGDTVTYTLAVVGSGQDLTMTDDLPAGVSPPLTHSPGLTYTPHRLAWSGSPDLGEQVTLTYVITVTAPSHTALWNRAVLTQTDGLTDTATALVQVDPVQVYLPIVLKDGV